MKIKVLNHTYKQPIQVQRSGSNAYIQPVTMAFTDLLQPNPCSKIRKHVYKSNQTSSAWHVNNI